MGQRALRALVQQRQVAVELGGDDALLDHLEHRGERGVVLRRQVQRRADPLDRLVGQGQLATRKDLDLVLVADGLARRGHHAADAIDLIAEELDAHRHRRLSGIDVDGVPVPPEQAGGVGGVRTGIPHAHEHARHVFERHLLAHCETRRCPIPALARRHAAEQRAGRRHQHAVLTPGHAAQRGAAGRDDGVVGSVVLPGIVGALREAHDVLETQIRGERAIGAVGRILTRHDIDRGARATSKLRCDHEGAAGLGNRQRGVFAATERRLDGLGRFGSVQLCGDAMYEHVRLHSSSVHAENPPKALGRVGAIEFLRLFYPSATPCARSGRCPPRGIPRIGACAHRRFRAPA